MASVVDTNAASDLQPLLHGLKPIEAGPYTFKLCDHPDESNQLHQLNYKTFVEEIPQHEGDGSGLLVDKFHDKNTYVLTKRGRRVVAMVAVHDQPPFSVADKMDEPEKLAGYQRPLEVRLLAIEPGERNSTIFAGMLWFMLSMARARGYTELLISGVESQLRLYRRLGFEPIGPAAKSGNAVFTPMALNLVDLPDTLDRDFARWTRHLSSLQSRHAADPQATTKSNGKGNGRLKGKFDGEPIHLLPGPVQLSPQVREALRQAPVYHRCEAFRDVYRRVREALANLVGGTPAALFTGSGTLANEVVGATLAADRSLKRGIVLVNGEFGSRLAQQGRRFGLEFDTVDVEWGKPWPLDRIARIAGDKNVNWVWAVHLETSTGMLNNLDTLRAIARKHDLRIALDCVSSLGAAPLDLSDIYLASAASGKSLAAKAGVAIVFARESSLARVERDRLATYFDLPAALDSDGPRFTFSSQDLLALDEALKRYAGEGQTIQFDHYAALGRYVRDRLRRMGLQPLVEEDAAAPIITTLKPPRGLNVQQFVDLCRSWNVLVGGESGYLQERQWTQIATMGDLTLRNCRDFCDRLEAWMAE